MKSGSTARRRLCDGNSKPADVTFVIAAYNSAETIASAIESALSQEAVALEVIVIDDKSSDTTRDVVASIGQRDPRVRLIALDKNLGPGGARNVGLDAATGRWIAVLDSDDVIKPARTARIISRAEKAHADIAVDNLDVVYTDGRPGETMFEEAFLERRGVLTLDDFIASNILFRSTFNFGYMKPMFRRDFLNTHTLRFHPTSVLEKTICFSPLRSPLVGFAPSNPHRAMSTIFERARSPACLSSTMWMR